MSEDGKYNGWTNYETWAVKLWLDNEEGSYNMVTEQAAKFYEEHAPDLEDVTPEDLASGAYKGTDDDLWQAASDMAAYLKDLHEEANPLEDAEASVFTDLLRAALSEVNWYEIGEAYINDAKEASE